MLKQHHHNIPLHRFMSNKQPTKLKSFQPYLSFKTPYLFHHHLQQQVEGDICHRLVILMHMSWYHLYLHHHRHQYLPHHLHHCPLHHRISYQPLHPTRRHPHHRYHGQEPPPLLLLPQWLQWLPLRQTLVHVRVVYLQ